MLIRGRAQRDKVSGLLEQWSDWVFSQNRAELKQLGIKSWLGDLVRNNNSDKNTYHEAIPVIDRDSYDDKMQVIDNAIKALPSLQRETILVEYAVRIKDRQFIRAKWLENSGRTHNSHRKMLSAVKDMLWLALIKSLDREQ